MFSTRFEPEGSTSGKMVTYAGMVYYVVHASV